jgi:hypothetical protein
MICGEPGAHIMTEMIERVAKAIEGAFGQDTNFSQDAIKGMARAAIEAMREPTAEMNVRPLSDQSEEFLDNYREMIDAALGKVDA